MASLSFFFLFLISAVSISTRATALHTDLLHAAGYSLLPLLRSRNFTGTLFLSPNPNYLLSSPLLLRYSDLLSLPSGSFIPMLSPSGRLFLLRNHSAYLCLSTSPPKPPHPHPCVKIRHPDLFSAPDLVVHGLDGVLDHHHGIIRALRRRGFHGVAGEIYRRKSELSGVPSITIFAHRGKTLPPQYDLLRHVATRRYRFLDLTRIAPRGVRIRTMAGNSSMVRIGGDGGGVTVDGIVVDGKEVFRNRWAVVLSIRDMLPISDDAADQVSNDGLDYNDIPIVGDSDDMTLDLDQGSPAPAQIPAEEKESNGVCSGDAVVGDAPQQRWCAGAGIGTSSYTGRGSDPSDVAGNSW